MAKNKKIKRIPQTNERSFMEKLLESTRKYKNRVFVGMFVIVAGVFAYSVFSQMRASNIEDANRQYDIAIGNIIALQYETNAEIRAEAYQAQINQMNNIIQTYPKTVASVRAGLLLGKVYYDEAYRSGDPQMLDLAINYYMRAFNGAESDFHKTLSLLGMAFSYEQKNDYVSSFANFEKVYYEFESEGFGAVALIGMARSKEIYNDIIAALNYYKQASIQYPDSQWSKYANGKIYYFEGDNQSADDSLQPSLGLPGLADGAINIFQ